VPRVSEPGECSSGRKKGAPNKATSAKVATKGLLVATRKAPHTHGATNAARASRKLYLSKIDEVRCPNRRGTGRQAESASSTSSRTCASFRPVRAGT
jgi:hypothetical protein